jgi:hypothetical protein
VNDVGHMHRSTGPAGQTLAASLQVEAAGRFDVISDGPPARIEISVVQSDV